MSTCHRTELKYFAIIQHRGGSVETQRVFQCSCQGCNARLKIEFVSEPVRTGAMWTVDCPVCGTSKMIPDDPVKIYYQKDGNWIETRPKSQHFGTGLSLTNDY